jgi:hypothetical protein
MKTATNIILIIVAIFALMFWIQPCKKHPIRIIISKSYTQNKLPKGICTYKYKGGGYLECVFEDSCNKYNVGDTIK